MITSSKFFNKSFFTVEYSDEKPQVNQVSPWGLAFNKVSLEDKVLSPIIRKRQASDMRGYQISRNSSQKYIQRKLKAKSHLHKSRDLQPVFDKSKFYTIEQRLNSIQAKINKEPESPRIRQRQKIHPTQSLQYLYRNPKHRKKQQLFPQLTINQYNDIKAKGSSLSNSNGNPIEEILERRKNRRKLLEEFGKVTGNTKGKGNKNASKSKSFMNKMEKKVGESEELDPNGRVLSGRYVCIAKNPQFSVNGLPTTKLLDQY